jgi:hypothetical protein
MAVAWAVSAEQPLTGQGGSWEKWRAELERRSARLARSRAPRADYPRLLEACAGCHQEQAPAALPRLERLRLR